MNLIHTRCLSRKSSETHLNTVTNFWTHRVIKLFGSFVDFELESSPSPPADDGLTPTLACTSLGPDVVVEDSTEAIPVGNTVDTFSVAVVAPPPEAIMFSQQMLPYLELSSTLDTLKAFSPLVVVGVESAVSVSEFIIIVFSGFFMSHEETSTF